MCDEHSTCHERECLAESVAGARCVDQVVVVDLVFVTGFTTRSGVVDEGGEFIDDPAVGCKFGQADLDDLVDFAIETGRL